MHYYFKFNHKKKPNKNAYIQSLWAYVNINFKMWQKYTAEYLAEINCVCVFVCLVVSIKADD